MKIDSNVGKLGSQLFRCDVYYIWVSGNLLWSF